MKMTVDLKEKSYPIYIEKGFFPVPVRISKKSATVRK